MAEGSRWRRTSRRSGPPAPAPAPVVHPHRGSDRRRPPRAQLLTSSLAAPEMLCGAVDRAQGDRPAGADNNGLAVPVTPPGGGAGQRTGPWTRSPPRSTGCRRVGRPGHALDEQRQWFRAKSGTELTETRRGLAFCAYTVAQEAPAGAGGLSADRGSQRPGRAAGPAGAAASLPAGAGVAAVHPRRRPAGPRRQRVRPRAARARRGRRGRARPADQRPTATALTLELTQTALVGDNPAVHAALGWLRGRGMKLALDDFGTGYSSAQYLQRFQPDVVKLDRCFVAGLGRSQRDDVIGASLVDLALRLGSDVVAEGIEHPGTGPRAHPPRRPLRPGLPVLLPTVGRGAREPPDRQRATGAPVTRRRRPCRPGALRTRSRR